MSEKKKKILLINSHFDIGGIESSLVNLSNELCDKYQVDLLIYYPEGPMKERLDPRVRVLKPSVAMMTLGMSVNQALHSGNLFLIIFKLWASVWARLFDNRLPIWIANKTQPAQCGYDLAVSFRQETLRKVISSGFVRTLDRCVDAKRKIVFLHFDATEQNNDNEFNRKYYSKAERIVGVSRSVSEMFLKLNPEFADKMDYCYNFMDYEKIYSKSEDEQQIRFPENKFICFSASRLGEEKGIVRAIGAFAPVFEKHKDIVWYIAGDGPERENIEAAISENGLNGRIILLGNQSNPYPYMKNADLYLSLSYHEAAPMVYMEAKALHVPVFSTRTSSTDEMLKDGVEDFICDNTEEGIRERFAEIMDNREMVTVAKANLADYRGNNDAAIAKFAEWME